MWSASHHVIKAHYIKIKTVGGLLIDKKRNTLVAYFSATGVIATAAKTIADAIGAELFEIKPETPYTSEELDWNNPESRSTIEMKDTSFRPAISLMAPDMDKYDLVFIGFPIWWFTAPTIINTFLESYDFSGKTIVPFATSLGSDIAKAEKDLPPSCSSSTQWKSGKVLSGITKSEALAWIDSLNLD